MPNELNRIPVGKVRRASKFITTGAKVGSNYIKHYASAAFKGELDKENLNQDNAKDIYDSLSELKGSALKMAQLLSMDQNILPKAYSERFSMAQYSAPPLSYPLVKKIFARDFGAQPHELFDTFDRSASNAASMGQVHKASKDGVELAVKVQYPGVADSIKSDLKLAKPFALKLMNIKGRDIDPYMKEVESKLMEEADYSLELEQSVEFSEKCKDIQGIFFPQYFKEFSSKQVLTMSWLKGEPIGAWMKREQTQEDRNALGQKLWDFYMFQMHQLKMMHADPHPGNFIIDKDNNLGVIDFGCIKKIPDDFYNAYFDLARNETLGDKSKVDHYFKELEITREEDTEKSREIVTGMFLNLIELLSEPFNHSEFDFGNNAYFAKIYEAGELIQKDPVFSKYQARGTRHFVYFNRTFFGLYNILNAMKSKINTGVPDNFLKRAS